MFIKKSNVLNSNQFGFRPLHSTYMALLDFYNKITESIESGEYTIGVFIDLKKAFNTIIIDHSILLQKLLHYGIRGVALKWFLDYLKNRKQYFLIEDVQSDEIFVTHGINCPRVDPPSHFVHFIHK